MKKKTDPETDLREVMLRHILQGEFSAQIEDDAINLSSHDGWWWRGKAAPIPQARLGKNLEAAFTMFNQLSERIVRGSDWLLIATQTLSLGNGSLGTLKEAAASAKSAGTKASDDHRSWRQGEMQLTLSVAKTKPFPVTLHIDEGPVLNITRMMWVDMDSVESDPLRPAAIRRFGVTPTSDERTFTVQAKPVEVTRRLTAIETAKKTGNSDARLLLPFVEWD
jgi:hypothetical protein